MFRVSALSGVCLLLTTVAAGANALGNGPAPADAPASALHLAQFRPSLDAANPPVVEAAIRPDLDVPKVQPALNARLAMRPKLVVKVSIASQTMTVNVEGETQHTWKVSTGAKGYRTPTGVWKPYRMHTMWRSRKYDNAPMPHSIFFTGGYAIHATPHVKRLGKPASHGCVRLHPDNAKELFRLAKLYGRDSMRVVVEQ